MLKNEAGTKNAGPISLKKVELANGWFDEVDSVKKPDVVLDLLSERFPGNDIESTLIKAVAINSLYGTNVFAIYNAAEHIAGELKNPKINYKDDKFINRLATIEVEQKGETVEKHFISFASKYAHFFINSQEFPMYDSYARRIIEAHIANNDLIRNSQNPYLAFKQNFFMLMDELKYKVSTRELDHYLWFVGQLKTWQGDHDSHINAGLRRLFNSKERYFENLWLEGDQSKKARH